MIKMCLRKKFLRFEHPAVRQTGPFSSGITVFMFVSTFKVTALLLESFHLRLHCYTLYIDTFQRRASAAADSGD